MATVFRRRGDTRLIFEGLPPIRHRTPLSGGADGLSGARLERGVLEDGTRVVLKHMPPEGDWLTRRTGVVRPTSLLWESGTLDRIAPAIDHCVIAVDQTDGREVVLMRDASDVLLRPGSVVPVDRARDLLAGLGDLHRHMRGADLDGLCPLDARLALFSPKFHAADEGPAPHPFRRFIVEGWEAFADLVPEDVAGAIFAIHDDPRRLAASLAQASPSTLIHGDAKLENLGLGDGRVVAIDWGDLTGIAPAALDVAWFASQDGWRFDVLPKEIFDAYDSVVAEPLGGRVRDLSCIAALAWFGFKLAGRCRSGDDAQRARSAELLSWWVVRVRDALPMFA